MVVINAKEIAVTGRKAERKLYRHYTGYPDGLKEINFSQLQQKKPEEVSTFFWSIHNQLSLSSLFEKQSPACY